MATNLLLEGDDLEALLIKAHSEGGPSARIVRADKYRHGGLWGFFARERFEVAVEIPELPARSQVTEPSAFFLPDVDAEPALPAIAGPGPATGSTVPAVPAQRRPGRHAGPPASPASTPATPTPTATPASSKASSKASSEASSETTAAYAATVSAAQARTGYRYAAPATTPSSAPAVAPVDSLLGLADRVSASEQAAVRARYADLDDALVLPDDAEARRHHEIDLLARELAQITLGGAAGGLSSTTPDPTPDPTARPRPTATATGGQAEAAWFGSGSSRRSTSGHADVPTDSTVIPPMSSSRPAATGQAGSTDTRTPGTHTSPASDGAGRIDEAGQTDEAVEARPSPVRSSTTRPEFTALLDSLRGDRPVDDLRTPAGTSPRGSRAHEAAPLRTTTGDTDITAPFALRFDLDPETDLGSAPAPDLTFDVMPPVARPTSGSADHAAGRRPVPAQSRTGRPSRPVQAARAVQPAQPVQRSEPAQPAQPAPPAQPAQEVQEAQPTDPAPRVPAQASPRTDPQPVQQSQRAQRAQQQVAPHEADDDESPEVGQRRSDKRAAADRRALRALGVPAAWTRRLRPGDRFGEVLRMLERMPSDDIDPATAMVAVVGPRSSVRMEAHRTALDLATDDDPRPVVVVPAAVGPDRAAAVARALRIGSVVLAVESDGEEAAVVLDTLTTVQAGAVIAIVDAAAPLERTQRWLDALGQVDALVLDGAATVPDPAAVLQLGLPVVRLDGIPIDRVTWAALLCAQLLAADTAEAAEAARTSAEAARTSTEAAGSGPRSRAGSRSGSRSGADAGSRAQVAER